MTSRKENALGAVLLAASLLLAAAPDKVEGGTAAVATAQINWPHWFWCFPECVFGQTCFYHTYHFCFKAAPGTWWPVCVVTALDWCDINHLHHNAGWCTTTCIPGEPGSPFGVPEAKGGLGRAMNKIRGLILPPTPHSARS